MLQIQEPLYQKFTLNNILTLAVTKNVQLVVVEGAYCSFWTETSFAHYASDQKKFCLPERIVLDYWMALGLIAEDCAAAIENSKYFWSDANDVWKDCEPVLFNLNLSACPILGGNSDINAIQGMQKRRSWKGICARDPTEKHMAIPTGSSCSAGLPELRCFYFFRIFWRNVYFS